MKVWLKRDRIQELIRGAAQRVSERMREKCSYGWENHGAHVDVLIITPDGDRAYYCPADGSVTCVVRQPWEAP